MDSSSNTGKTLIFINISCLGYEKCILVVHDWGGIVGYDFVLRNPEMVEKFVICNIPHPRAFFDNFTLKQLLMSW